MPSTQSKLTYLSSHYSIASSIRTSLFAFFFIAANQAMAETPCIEHRGTDAPEGATEFELKMFGQQTIYNGDDEKQFLVCIRHLGKPSRISGINVVNAKSDACLTSGKVSGTSAPEVRFATCIAMGGKKLDIRAHCSSIDNVHRGYYIPSESTLSWDWSQANMMKGIGDIDTIAAGLPDGHVYRICNPGLDTGERKTVHIVTRSSADSDWETRAELKGLSCQDVSAKYIGIDAGDFKVTSRFEAGYKALSEPNVSHSGDATTVRYCFKRVE